MLVSVESDEIERLLIREKLQSRRSVGISTVPAGHRVNDSSSWTNGTSSFFEERDDTVFERQRPHTPTERGGYTKTACYTLSLQNTSRRCSRPALSGRGDEQYSQSSSQFANSRKSCHFGAMHREPRPRPISGYSMMRKPLQAPCATENRQCLRLTWSLLKSQTALALKGASGSAERVQPTCQSTNI
jgi:hypothetical protein